MDGRLTYVLFAAALLLACPAASEVVMPYSVVGSGGGEASGDNHTLLGTLGQSVIGVVSGPSNINEIGFWYQPGWILTGVDGDLLPTMFWLGQNYPNPFNPVTTFSFALPERARVTVKLYDVAGREVRTLVDKKLEPGYHHTVVDGDGLSSGVYFCRMVAERFVETKKLVLLK